MASERENIARPPTTTTISPTPAHCGGPCRSADRRTHMCRRGKEKEREDSGGSGNAANIFGATARTRSSSGCHCHRRRCQRQRRRCYFVSVVSTVDTKSKKHFTTMSILNMATLHCTHIHRHTHVHAHHTLAPLCRQCVVASVSERERGQQNDLNDNCEKV